MMNSMKLQRNGIFYVILATVCVLNHGCGSGKDRTVSAQRTTDGTVDPDSVVVEPTSNSVETLIVDDLGNGVASFGLLSGTKQRVLDAFGLQAQFKNVFGVNNVRGTQWVTDVSNCFNPLYNQIYQFDRIVVNASNHFAPLEEAALGTRRHRVSIFSPASVSRMSIERNSSVSLSYLKTLRGYLADTCRVRIAKDFAQLIGANVNVVAPRYECNGVVPANVNMVVTADGSTVLMRKLSAPTATDVSGFMSVMFGLPVDDNEIHYGAEEYAEIFPEAIASWRDNEGIAAGSTADYLRMRGLYEMLCIAVGSDQRAFMR